MPRSFGRFSLPNSLGYHVTRTSLIADEVQQLGTVDHALSTTRSREAGSELNALRSFSSIIILPAIPLRPAATWK